MTKFLLYYAAEIESLFGLSNHQSDSFTFVTLCNNRSLFGNHTNEPFKQVTESTQTKELK